MPNANHSPELRQRSQQRLAEMFDRVLVDGKPPAESGRVDDFSRGVFEKYAAEGGDADLHALAAETFAGDKFVHAKPRPIFAEHEVPVYDKDGKPGGVEKYDRAALEAIAAKCNERIRDTGDFAPLVNGHTPDKPDPSKEPEVLGYSGPFYVGMIGNVNPRWAIFADEWHHADSVEKLAKMQRRSPEVWKTKRMEDRILDPIAALGATTPRLDMGLGKFCRMVGGEVVEKYTSVFYPETDSSAPATVSPKGKYSLQGESDMSDLSPDLKTLIADAVKSAVAEAVHAVRQEAPVTTDKYAKDPKKDDKTDDDDDTSDMDDEEKEEYSKLSARGKKAYKAGRKPIKDNYSREAAEADRAILERQVRDLKTEVEFERTTRVMKDRFHRLESLAHDFEFSIETEMEDTKALNDEAFEKHVNRIKTNYSKRMPEKHIPFPAPTAREVGPNGQDAGNAAEKYAKFSGEVRKVAQRKGLSVEEARAEVAKQLNMPEFAS